jgi:hypothetical protein
MICQVNGAVTQLSRLSWRNGGELRIKGEYGREVGSRAFSQLVDTPRKTLAPVNYDEVTLVAVNRQCSKLIRFAVE